MKTFSRKPTRYYGQEIAVLGGEHLLPAGRPYDFGRCDKCDGCKATPAGECAHRQTINPQGPQIRFRVAGTGTIVETTLNDPGFRKSCLPRAGGLPPVKPLYGKAFDEWFHRHCEATRKAFFALRPPPLRISAAEDFKEWQTASKVYALDLFTHPENYDLRGQTPEQALKVTGYTVERRSEKGHRREGRAHRLGTWSWLVLHDGYGTIVKETDHVFTPYRKAPTPPATSAPQGALELGVGNG